MHKHLDHSPLSPIGDPLADFIRSPDNQSLRLAGYFVGGLNISVAFRDFETGEAVMFRTPKLELDRMMTHMAIKDEYDAIGATARGIDFRIRTPDEQEAFTAKLRSRGLNVPEVRGRHGIAMVTDFVDGTPLHDYVRQPEGPDKDVLGDILTHMADVHRDGIVFGDRWATNTIVKPGGEFVELDFDIELVGDHSITTAFELSQTLYHLMHFADNDREGMKDMLVEVYTERPHLLAGYAFDEVYAFTRGQVEYFYNHHVRTGDHYEGIVPPYIEIYQLMNSLGDIAADQTGQPAA